MFPSWVPTEEMGKGQKQKKRGKEDVRTTMPSVNETNMRARAALSATSGKSAKRETKGKEEEVESFPKLAKKKKFCPWKEETIKKRVRNWEGGEGDNCGSSTRSGRGSRKKAGKGGQRPVRRRSRPPA